MSNFLKADDMLVFDCSFTDAKGSYDGQSFVVHGPIAAFSDAFDKAFKGYDYDYCRSVYFVNNVNHTFIDVTKKVKDLFDDEQISDWVQAHKQDKCYCPRFMEYRIASMCLQKAE